MWLLPWLLVLLASFPGTLVAFASAGDGNVPGGRTVTAEGADWTTNNELKKKFRDVLSQCIAAVPSSASSFSLDNSKRVRRDVSNVSITEDQRRVNASGTHNGLSQTRNETTPTLDLSGEEPYNLTPCAAMEHKTDPIVDSRKVSRNLSKNSGRGANGRRSSNSRTLGGLKDGHAQLESINEKENYTDNDSGSRNLENGRSSRLRSENSDNAFGSSRANYQYEVPDYGGGWGSRSGGGGMDGQWGGGSPPGGFGGRNSGASTYSNGDGGGNYGEYNPVSDRDRGYRNGFSGGGFDGGYGNSGGGNGRNGREGGFPMPGGYGSRNRNYGYNENSNDRGIMNDGNFRNSHRGGGEGGGARRNGWSESDGETFHRVGSGGYSANRRDNRNGERGYAHARDTRVQDDSSEDDDYDGSEMSSDEDDDAHDSNRKGASSRGNKRKGSRSQDDHRRSGSGSQNSRGKHISSDKSSLLAAIDPDNPRDDEDDSGSVDIHHSRSHSRRRHRRSVSAKIRSHDGGHPCVVQCALIHLGVVDDLGFPCEEKMRRMLLKILGDTDGAVAAADVSNCLLRISAAVDEDTCNAADRLMACLLFDVDLLLQEMTAHEVEATTMTPALVVG